MILSFLFAAGLLLLLIDFSYVLARAMLPHAMLSLRWCAVSTIATWVVVALFHILASFKAFFPLPVLISLLCITAAVRLSARPQRVWARISDDLRRAAEIIVGDLKSPGAWVVWCVMLLLVAGISRALLMPPLAHDSLTYHLVLASRWIQSGERLIMPAPDAWTYYQYLPANGEVISAWLMLPFHDDRLATLSAVPSWLTVVLAIYVLGQQIGMAPAQSRQTALIAASVPAVLAYIVSAYVDITILASILCMTIFVLILFRDRVGAAALIALMAGGVAVGVKFTSVPLVIVLFAAILLSVLHAPRSGRHLIYLGAGLLCFVTVSVPWYWQAWRDHGSIFYPMHLEFMHRTISEGSPSLSRSLVPSPVIMATPLRRAFTELKIFVPHFITQGLLSLWSLCVAPWALRHLWRRGMRTETILLLAMIAVGLLGYYSGAARGVRLNWPAVSARFATAPYTMLILMAAAWVFSEPHAATKPSTRRYFILYALAGINLLMGWGWVRCYTLHALVMIGALSLVILASLYALHLYSRRMADKAHRSHYSQILAGLGLIALACVIQPIRERSRAEFLATCSEVGKVEKIAVPAWVWAEQFRTPVRIACTAGFLYPGHNWFIYPLFGSDLRNEVEYVPVTRDGRIIDYEEADRLLSSADRESWLARLNQRQIDVVICLMPKPVEDEWMRAMPNLFHLVQNTPRTAIYMIDKTAIASYMSASRTALFENPAGTVAQSSSRGPVVSSGTLRQSPQRANGADLLAPALHRQRSHLSDYFMFR